MYVLAYDYPLLGLLLTLLWFALLIGWLTVLFRVAADLFTSDDLGGWAKALWILGILIVPFLGVLLYLLVRGDAMARHAAEALEARDAAARAYIRDAAGSRADEIGKLAALREQGTLTDEEFTRAKAHLING